MRLGTLSPSFRLGSATPSRIYLGSALVWSAGGADAYRAAVMADSPVAYWRLGESSGTVAVDETGNYPGAYQNTPTLGVVGAISGATSARFATASNQRTLISSSASAFSFIPNTGVFTIEAWVKLAAATGDLYHCIFGTSPATAEKGFQLVWENRTAASSVKELRMFITKGTSGVPVIDSRSADNAIIDTSWHHIVVTGNGANCQFYIDAVQQSGSTTMGPKSTGNLTRDVAIGDAPFSSQLPTANATMGEVAIYNTALSPARIAAHYAAAGY